MNILIFEGIATSGKSTVINGLRDAVDGVVRVAGEPETHIPIMYQTSQLHVDFFVDLIHRLTKEQPDLLIFDRLYLTQAFRAHAVLSKYARVEELLKQYATRTIFLKVRDEAIAERVAKAAEHRDASWKEYIQSKGGSPREIAQYYITQQRSQLKLLETSILPYSVFDTTGHSYQKIIHEVTGLLKTS